MHFAMHARSSNTWTTTRIVNMLSKKQMLETLDINHLTQNLKMNVINNIGMTTLLPMYHHKHLYSPYDDKTMHID